jgi:hypothetical protein
MTAERLFNTLAAHLRTKTLAAGGVFAQSETVEHTLSLLSGSAGRFRVILQWQQEKPGSGRGVRGGGSGRLRCSRQHRTRCRGAGGAVARGAGEGRHCRSSRGGARPRAGRRTAAAAERCEGPRRRCGAKRRCRLR